MRHRLRIRNTNTGEEIVRDFDTAVEAFKYIKKDIGVQRKVFVEKFNDLAILENFDIRDAHLKRIIANCDALTEFNGAIFSPCLRQHYDLRPLTPLEQA